MEHKVGDFVAITKGHGFLGGSLGDVIKATSLECIIELVVPYIAQGMTFKQATGKHRDFEAYQMHTLDGNCEKCKSTEG